MSEIDAKELIAKRKTLQKAHELVTSVSCPSGAAYQKHLVAALAALTAAIGEIKVPQ